MGLLIKLKNGDTQLKSLKFGKDQPGGGDSNQPFIKKSIEQDSKNPAFYNDFILRGGIEAPLSAAEDVARLTKYFFNFNNPSGLLFTAKQNILSRSGTKTEASRGAAYLGGGLNEGAYTPLSTLAEAGVGFLGIHLNKQGIDPTGLIPSLSIKNYQDAIKQNQLIGPFIPENNRLTQLTSLVSQSRSENNFSFVKGYGLNIGNSVVSYTGGPDSVIGVGTTYVKFATDNADVPLKTLTPKPAGYLIQNRDYYIPTGSVYKPGQPLVKNPDKYLGDEFTSPVLLTTRQDIDDYLVGKTYKSFQANTKWRVPIGASFEYNFTDKPNSTPPSTFNLDEFENGATTTPPDLPIENNLIKGPDSYELYDYASVYKPGTLIPINDVNSYLTGSYFTTTRSSESAIYSSPINNLLRAAGIGTTPGVSGSGRQIVVDPVYNINLGHFAAIGAKDTGDTSSGTVLGQYSSKNTLFNDNLNQAYTTSPKDHKEGYLANLDKNSGYYYDPKGNLAYVLNQYPRGIAPDFRKTSRKIRGFNDAPESEFTNYDKITDSSDYIGENAPLIDKIYYGDNAQKRISAPINSGNDIIKFRITIVNPTSPSDSSNTLNFRAYIDDFSDSYGADWGSQTYMGRGEKFYKYNSFTRDISLGFTIVADNSSSLDTMYSQLNALAASIAPTYTDAGYMAGNLHRLTVGDYLYEQWGIMGGFTYEVIQDSPWEITEGKQVPMYIKVSGIKFTPIHNFRPEYDWNRTNKYLLQNSATNNS
jgi:hypothetical protein